MDLDHDKTIAIAEGILIERHRITQKPPRCWPTSPAPTASR
jgi:hypothetical protein